MFWDKVFVFVFLWTQILMSKQILQLKMVSMTSSTILVALLLTVLLQGREINKDEFMEQGGDDITSPLMPMTLYGQLNYIAAMQVINQINSQNNTYTVELNKFASMSQDQKQKVLGLIPRQPNLSMKVSASAIPPSGDQTRVAAGASPMTYNISWRNETLAIRDQGMCGSCWVFSALPLLEQWQIRINKTRYSQSAQQALSCNSDNLGCSGGYVESVFAYAIATGITRDTWYPYTGMDQPCKILAQGSPLYKIRSFKILPRLDCQAMITALKAQIVSVAVGPNDDFMYYSKGVLTKCGTLLQHAVALVGYVSNSTDNYYVIRNSWGTGWGEGGYARTHGLVLRYSLEICAEYAHSQSLFTLDSPSHIYAYAFKGQMNEVALLFLRLITFEAQGF